MRAKFALLFVTLSMLACMQQAQDINVTQVPASISAQPTQASLENQAPVSGNKPKTPQGTVYTSATVIAIDALNIRTAPNAWSATNGYLINGETVIVISCDGIWAKIGEHKFVNSTYLDGSTCK